MNKKFKILSSSMLAMGAIASPIATLVSCGGNSSYVQMVTDSAPIEDKSFNEQARDGAKEWANKNGKTWGASKSKSSSASDLSAAWQAAVDAGAQAVITTGFGSDKAFKPFALKNKDKKFVFIDGPIDGVDNLVALTYKSEQAGFLAGIATGLTLNLNFDKFKAKGLSIGAWGGLDIDSVNRFIGGVQQGISYFNMKMAKDQSHQIKWLKPGANRASMYSGNFDAGKGTDKANKLLDQHADILLAVAGTQTNDAIAAIKDKNTDSLVIGVDTDQTIALGDDGKYAFTSIMKDVKASVMQALDVLLLDKKIPGIEAGKTAIKGLDSNFVKIAKGLIGGNGKTASSAVGDIVISIEDIDNNTLNSLFNAATVTKLTGSKNKNIKSLADLYKSEAEKATPNVWSGFSGGSKSFDQTKAAKKL